MARVDRRLIRAFIVLLLLLVGVVLSLPLTLPRGVRVRLVAALSERFESEVELEQLRVSTLPRLRVEGSGLVLRHEGRTDVPPLIVIDAFSAEAGLMGLIGRPLRLRQVRLHGLQINVPPGGLSIDGDRERRNGHRGASGTLTAPPPVQRRPSPPKRESPIVVDDLTSSRATLTLLRRTPGKPPRVFDIHHLSMQDTGADVPWRFRATLTNPTPPGQIETSGRFGPWNAPEPSVTPLEGKYRFQDANLGVFDGIRGTLNSTGSFAGVLERIEVDGEAAVPDFALDDVGQPVALKTRFHSVVDGTSGNTWLKPVDATFRRTEIRADGGVVEREGGGGRTISLDVAIDDGRIEDILRLVAKGPRPPMTGAFRLRATFTLPPGRGKVVNRVRIAGSFQIARARFTMSGVQKKVDELSRKARPGTEEDDDSVASNFDGRFAVAGGIIRIPRVTFAIPGAEVDVNGAYTLRSEALDFDGTVTLEAKLSQMTTGIKSFLLKAVDPLFRRGGRTVIPIEVTGTVDEPKAKLDVGRALRRK